MKQEWILCDLHTHSEYSAKNKSGDKDKVKEMTAGEFVESLRRKNVKLFSVTDHNYFSKKYYDEIDKYISDNNIEMKVIPGAELDVYIDPEKQDFIHICFYFKEDTDRAKLEEMLNDIYEKKDGKGIKNPLFTDILEKLSDLNTKFIVVPHGDKDKRGIFDIVRKNDINNKPEFYKYAMYKIYNAFDVKSKFFEKSVNFWAANFFEHTKVFNDYIKEFTEDKIRTLEQHIVNKIKNNNFPFSAKEESIYKYILNYGSYFAYFSFSDWHNKSPYNPTINNFIFGSLDCAFESFEMATLDPVSRIQQSKDDHIEISKSILDSIEFKINGKENRISFSPGLNTIVGKRGSGKSLLLACIKNLVDQDSSEGALKKYKSLNISDIRAYNRGGISISLGSLGSVQFLTQNNINTIFENPALAEEEISKNFKNILELDKSDLIKIVNICKQIKPFDLNYKNITNNLLDLKASNDYSYSAYDFSFNNSIAQYFTNAIEQLNNAKESISTAHLNVDEINILIKQITIIKEKYIKLLELYNSLVLYVNKKIEKINELKTSNQSALSANRKAIEECKNVLINNLNIKLYLEELRVAKENFEIKNPPVEVKIKGKYLFATYYEFPDDLKERVFQQIYSTLNRGSCFEDIESYVYNNGKKLNKTPKSLAHHLEQYINSEIFQSRRAFYEIENLDLDYEKEIKNADDLKQFTNNGYLKDLSNASLGTKSVAYLDMLFDLEGNILVLDQPEDNIDNDYISNYLVPNIKNKKKIKQLIFVTHNPSVAVYGDAFNYIYAENDSEIHYSNYFIEKVEDKEKLIKILEGGKYSFSNRNKKYGNILGEEEYGSK